MNKLTPLQKYSDGHINLQDYLTELEKQIVTRIDSIKVEDIEVVQSAFVRVQTENTILKEQLFDALETAIECTGNQYSFGDIGFDMRKRRNELEQELRPEPIFDVIIGGDSFSITSEIESKIMELYWKSKEYQD